MYLFNVLFLKYHIAAQCIIIEFTSSDKKSCWLPAWPLEGAVCRLKNEHETLQKGHDVILEKKFKLNMFIFCDNNEVLTQTTP